MWHSLATTVEEFRERAFPMHRQHQMTVIALMLLLVIAVALILLIGWVDIFFA